MKNAYRLLVPLMLLAAGLQAQKVMVTFQVDMNKVALTNGVSANGVHVAGNFQGWDPAATGMEDPVNSGIFRYTVEVDNGFNLEYKFINGNAWGFDEANNRTFTVMDDGTGKDTIPLVCFNEQGLCDNQGVTFRVDLNDEIISGQFDPATETMSVAGSFQGWTPGATPLTDADGDGVYTANVALAEGEIQYKFVKGASGWEGGDVGNCPTSVGGNRAATVVANTTLPVVCYNKCGACEFTEPPAVYQVTFQVDMSNMILLTGTKLDSVYVAGAFQGWSPGNPENALTDPDGDGIYTGIDSVLAGKYQFKYLYGSVWGFDETALGAQDCGKDFGGNRQFEVVDSDIVLDPLCFNTCENCNELGDTFNLTLLLDLSSEIPNNTGVFVEGDINFQWPQFRAGVVEMEDLGNGIYKWGPAKVYAGKFTFFFSNGNGKDNTETVNETNDDNPDNNFVVDGCGIFNPVGTALRLLDLTTQSNDTIIGYVWNSCEAYVSGTEELTTLQDLRVFPNPFADFTLVQFENPTNALHRAVVRTVTGQEVFATPFSSENAIRIDRGGMAPGFYLLTLTNNLGQQTTRKLVVR